jgi:hypothetical protein
VWRYGPVIPTCRRMKKDDHEFKASLDYISKYQPSLVYIAR